MTDQHTPPTSVENDTPASERDSLPAAPDMTTPIGKALLSLTRALATATASAVDSAATAEYERQMTALRPLAGNAAIDNAIAQLTREYEQSTLSARKTAAFAIRNEYAEAFTQLARYGLPDAVKPTSAKLSAGTVKTVTPPTDTDGHTYSKVGTPVAAYIVTGESSCQTCPVALEVTKAPTYSKVGNYRQNLTRALEKMSSAEIDAHAACFASARDAEATVFGAQIINVNTYVRNA